MRRAIAFIATLLASAVAAAQADAQKSVQQLVGSWKLLSYEDRDAGGVVVRPHGKSPAGLLIYDSTGHMAIQIMKAPPSDVATDDWDKFTAAEKVALWDGYVAYFGRFEVDTARHVVIHLPEADLSRLYIGRREERHFELVADRLILSELWNQSGKQWTGVRTFQRLKR